MNHEPERRNWTRLNTVFPVIVESSLFGFQNCIARNISGGGIFLEARDLLPLGTDISVFFSLPSGGCRIMAQGEVKNHYVLNYQADEGPRAFTGMGVRFTKFEDDGLFELQRSLLATVPAH